MCQIHTIAGRSQHRSLLVQVTVHTMSNIWSRNWKQERKLVYLSCHLCIFWSDISGHLLSIRIWIDDTWTSVSNYKVWCHLVNEFKFYLFGMFLNCYAEFSFWWRTLKNIVTKIKKTKHQQMNITSCCSFHNLYM